MKKSLLALAVLGAFAGAAQAQSAVTIYGSVDGGVRHRTNANAAGDSIWTMGSNGTFNNNRLGFKGVEDLGGGLNAHFTLESGFNTGTGALDNATTTTTNGTGVPVGTSRLFQRSAFVGIGGSWGSVDLGRQYSVNFKTIGLYDPFSYKYTGIIPLASQGGLTRLDNDIQYGGTFGPVTVRAEYALGEVAGSTSNNSTQAFGASYADGPITVGAAYTQRKNNLATPVAPPAVPGAANFQDQKNWTIGGAYATGPFRVTLGYADSKQDTGVTLAPDVRTKTSWVGGSYNVTAEAALTAGYFETKGSAAGVDVKNKLFIVGGTYAFSKRTNLYADFDNSRTSSSTGASIPTVNGFSVGINHLF